MDLQKEAIRTKVYRLYLLLNQEYWRADYGDSYASDETAGQCRKKCSLSSMHMQQAHKGVRLSKPCLNLCSFNILNPKRSFVMYLTLTIPLIVYMEFF